MTGAEPSVAASTAPDWLANAPREGAFAGLVRIELPEDALPWRGAIDERVLRLRAQYTAGVELIARSFGALEPFAWQGDTLLLVFGGVPTSELPRHTFTAAKELWDRVRTELDLPVKIAAHAGRVRAGAEPGMVAGSDVDVCSTLAADAPVGTIALSEELALALPEKIKPEVMVLGNRPGEERLVYAFPRGAATTAVHGLSVGESPHVWSKFRSYGAGPDVRLLRYVGFRLQKREPPRLDILEVFVLSEVELRRRADADRRKKQALEEALLPSPWSARGPAGTEEGKRDFRELYAKYRSIVVLGDPGSGKTTLLRWLAVIAASGSFALDAELGVAERLLPLPVSVGRLAEVRRGQGGEGVSVLSALTRYFHDRSVIEDEAKVREFLVRELDRGRCLILLDGLDEVKGEERQAIYQWLESFAAEYSHNRFVVSSRVVGYTGFQLPGDVAEAVLRPFTEAQVERYVRAFHRAYVFWETKVEPTMQTEADRLLEALRASPRLSALATNPFMLSALALIHRAEGKLPRHRVQAYEVFARALCETWAEARRLVAGEAGAPVIEYEEEALPILGELALAMHEQYPTGVAPEEFVLRKLAEALGEQKGVSGAKAQRAAREFLKRAGEDVQILLERGAGEWGFLHLTFQEFFVAAGLHAKDDFEGVAIQHLFDPRWEEVIRLGVGYLALVQKRPIAAQRFVKQVLEHQEPEPRAWFTRLLRKQIPMAALLAAEAGDALSVALQERVVVAFADWLAVMPRDISKPILGELVLTDFSGRVMTACRPLLKDTDAELRRRMAIVLGSLRNLEAVDDVVALIYDDDAEVREAVVSALCAMRVPDMLEKMSAKLTDARPEVRAAATEVLASLGPDLPTALIRTALQDPYDRVRATAVRMLAFCEEPEARIAVRTAGVDASAEVRDEAITVMRQLRMVSDLANLADDRDVSGVGVSVAFALCTVDLPTAITLAKTKDENHVLRRIVALHTLERESVEERLARLRTADSGTLMYLEGSLRNAEEALKPLLAMCQDPSPLMRKRAVDLLGSFHDQDAIDACRAALADAEPAVALEAALALADHRILEALPYLVKAFRERSAYRARITDALVRLDATEAADLLVDTFLADGSGGDVMLVFAIGRLASSRHIERLMQFLERRQQPSTRSDRLMTALWSIANREARRPPDPSG